MQDVDDPRIRRGMETQLKLRRERIAAGEQPLGWKVGFGAPGAMQKLQISAPLIGFLMQSAVVSNGETVSLAGWKKPVAEPEVAIYLGRDVSAGADENEVRASIMAVGPVFELADLFEPPEDAERILACNIYQRHVVLGPRDETRAGARIESLDARIFRNGEEVAQTADVEANTGKLVGLTRHVADTLALFGERLRAGEIIIPGSIVPPLFIGAQDEGAAFRLEPVGEVSVRFSGAGT